MRGVGREEEARLGLPPMATAPKWKETDKLPTDDIKLKEGGDRTGLNKKGGFK